MRRISSCSRIRAASPSIPTMNPRRYRRVPPARNGAIDDLGATAVAPLLDDIDRALAGGESANEVPADLDARLREHRVLGFVPPTVQQMYQDEWRPADEARDLWATRSSVA
jgi:hypothetical protein